MDQPPETDKVENPSQGDNTADLDSRLGQAEDYQATDQAAQASTDQAAQPAAQSDAGTGQTSDSTAQPNPAGKLEPANPAAQPEKPPEPPPGHQPAQTDGTEKAGANKIETGAEKPEIEYWTHGGGPEKGF